MISHLLSQLQRKRISTKVHYLKSKDKNREIFAQSNGTNITYIWFAHSIALPCPPGLFTVQGKKREERDQIFNIGFFGKIVYVYVHVE